jgi:hypothetical protein
MDRRDFILNSSLLFASANDGARLANHTPDTSYDALHDREPLLFNCINRFLYGWEVGELGKGKHYLPYILFNELTGYSTRLSKPGFKLYGSRILAIGALYSTSTKR